MRIHKSLVPLIVLASTITACQGASPHRAGRFAVASSPATPPTQNSSPTVPPDEAIPRKGAGTFATAPASLTVIGSGRTRVRYRVEVENGIAWGNVPKWTPASFAKVVREILAAPRGWAWSAKYPVTNADVRLTNATWSFRQVANSTYDVRIRLATPDVVDRACGAQGLSTEGVYSCRFGKTIMVNLRRWLQGAPGFPVSIDEYRTGVINHEMGHYLGFNHMACPGPGQLAPVMATQTIDLGGCLPNVHPFAQNGRFVSGPWRPS